MGAKGAVEIIFRGKDVEKRTAEYEQTFANPMVRARMICAPSLCSCITRCAVPRSVRPSVASSMTSSRHVTLAAACARTCSC